MLPVSGAEQLKTSGAKNGARLMISQSGENSRVGEAGAVLAVAAETGSRGLRREPAALSDSTIAWAASVAGGERGAKRGFVE